MRKKLIPRAWSPCNFDYILNFHRKKTDIFPRYCDLKDFVVTLLLSQSLYVPTPLKNITQTKIFHLDGVYNILFIEAKIYNLRFLIWENFKMILGSGLSRSWRVRCPRSSSSSIRDTKLEKNLSSSPKLKNVKKNERTEPTQNEILHRLIHFILMV